MPAKAPSANLEYAISEYISGQSLNKAASTWHISYLRLRDTLASRGLLRTRDEISAARSFDMYQRAIARDTLDRHAIATRYLAGESENALAKEFGVARDAIRTRLLREGVTPRDSTSANRLMMQSRTPEQNAINSANAHEAVRGRIVSFREKCLRAVSRERTQSHASTYERQMIAWLGERGANATLQKAVGPYNLDIAFHPVAVEIYGGGWHANGSHASRAPERFDYILNQGWSVVIIWIDKRRGSFTVAAADYVIAHIERTRLDPTLIGQYGVIRGNGEEVAAFSANIDNISRVPPLEGRFD